MARPAIPAMLEVRRAAGLSSRPMPVPYGGSIFSSLLSAFEAELSEP
jgi:hypothetical protein